MGRSEEAAARRGHAHLAHVVRALPAGVTRDGDGRLFTSDRHSLEGADAVVATGPDSARFDVRTMELARFLNVGGLAGSYAIALR